LAGRFGGKKLLGIPNYRKDNIKMVSQETGGEGGVD
jgi:hypothetical protein